MLVAQIQVHWEWRNQEHGNQVKMQEFPLDLTEEWLHIKITENIEAFWKGLTLNQQQPQ